MTAAMSRDSVFPEVTVTAWAFVESELAFAGRLESADDDPHEELNSKAKQTRANAISFDIKQPDFRSLQ